MGAGKGFFTDYPKHVFLILGNEFCERFSFYGMKAILVLFLTRALKFSDNAGTSIYHGFNMACYFMPLFGAMLADGFLGKYKTILIISVVYAIGNIFMTAGAIPIDGVNFTKAIPFVGMALIAVGTGGIKPCVSAFGADQFQDHQLRQKQTFFSMFYMAINLGSLMSTIITPIIRSSVVCFDQECYALAFGIPAALMLISVVVFIIGTKWYTITPPGENIIGKLFGCIGTALKGKCGCSGQEKGREHWLDYADSKYEKKFIDEVKAVMRVLYMFIPLPIFWALFDQQGSRWVLQAALMDGDFGVFVIQPDMIHVLNSIFVVILVPVTESLLFPCLDKLNIPNRPLQRLGLGMFLAGTAFVITALLQIAIDGTLPPPIASTQSRFKVLNAIPCDISGRVTLLDSTQSVYNFSIPYDNRLDTKYQTTTDVNSGNYTFSITFKNCRGSKDPVPRNEIFDLAKGTSYNVIAYWDTRTEDGKLSLANQPLITKTGKGQSRAQFFNAWNQTEELRIEKNVLNATYLETSTEVTLSHGTKQATVGGIDVSIVSKAGAVSTVVLHYTTINATTQTRTSTQFVDLSPNTVNILWQVPQYFVMTLGEVFFSVTGLSFAYSQAPTSMKAVLQAAWLLTNALGNSIVMIITAIGKLPNQMAEFFLFAGLMYVTVIIFALMSLSYKYVKHDVEEDEEDDKGEKSEKQGVDNVAMVTADEIPPKYDDVRAADVENSGVQISYL